MRRDRDVVSRVSGRVGDRASCEARPRSQVSNRTRVNRTSGPINSPRMRHRRAISVACIELNPGAPRACGAIAISRRGRQTECQHSHRRSTAGRVGGVQPRRVNRTNGPIDPPHGRQQRREHWINPGERIRVHWGRDRDLVERVSDPNRRQASAKHGRGRGVQPYARQSDERPNQLSTDEPPAARASKQPPAARSSAASRAERIVGIGGRASAA